MSISQQLSGHGLDFALIQATANRCQINFHDAILAKFGCQANLS
jgi:hypothetical protein